MSTGGYASQSLRADLPQAALAESLAKLRWNITGERMTAFDRSKLADFDLAISSEGNPAAVGLVQSYAGTRP